MSEPYPKVTALVSVYRGERYIKSCIRDLMKQTLFERDELEILVLDACSPESEFDQIVDYCEASPDCIKYVRFDERLNLYETWNYGAEIARGNYLTSANVDDLHKPDCLELLAAKLDQHEEIGLVYGQQVLTTAKIDSFEDADRNLSNYRPLFFAPNALFYNPCGSQPMWRKQMHQKLQGFDESFKIAGDYDFLLRAAQVAEIQKVEDAWGVFLDRYDSLSRSGIIEELQRIESKHANAETILKLYASEGFKIERDEDRVVAFEDFIRRCLFHIVVWGGRWSTRSNYPLATVVAKALEQYCPSKSEQWIEVLGELRLGILKSDRWVPWRKGFLSVAGDPWEPFAENGGNLSSCPEWIKRVSEQDEVSLVDLCWAGCGINPNMTERLIGEEVTNRKIYIWGFSETGKKIQRLLENMEIRVAAFIDQKAEHLSRQHPEQRIFRYESIDQKELQKSFIFIATGDKLVVEKHLEVIGLAPEIDFV